MQGYKMGNGRFDYAKFIIDAEPDRFAQLYQVVEQAVNGLHGEGVEVRPARLSVLKPRVQGLRTYSIELQGPSAMAVKDLDIQTWRRWCTRLDVRVPITVTKEGQDRLLMYLEEHGAGRRSFGKQNSRERRKQKGRDGGGVTVNIGSHKSDYRCSIYYRGQELGAIEWLFEGPRLQTAVTANASMALGNYEPYKSDPWGSVYFSLINYGEMEVHKDTGLDVRDVCEIAAGGPLPHNAEELFLERMERDFQHLSRPAQLSFLEALESKPLQPSREGIGDSEAAS